MVPLQEPVSTSGPSHGSPPHVWWALNRKMTKVRWNTKMVSGPTNSCKFLRCRHCSYFPDWYEHVIGHFLFTTGQSTNNIVASELNDLIWHSSEWQIGSFSSEATICLSPRALAFTVYSFLYYTCTRLVSLVNIAIFSWMLCASFRSTIRILFCLKPIYNYDCDVRNIPIEFCCIFTILHYIVAFHNRQYRSTFLLSWF